MSNRFGETEPTVPKNGRRAMLCHAPRRVCTARTCLRAKPTALPTSRTRRAFFPSFLLDLLHLAPLSSAPKLCPQCPARSRPCISVRPRPCPTSPRLPASDLPIGKVSGANRGIGLGLVTALAKQPQNLIFAGARDPSKADALNALAEANPNVKVIQLTSADLADNKRAVAEIQKTVDHLDVVIANAVRRLLRGATLVERSRELFAGHRKLLRSSSYHTAPVVRGPLPDQHDRCRRAVPGHPPAPRQEPHRKSALCAHLDCCRVHQQLLLCQCVGLVSSRLLVPDPN